MRHDSWNLTDTTTPADPHDVLRREFDAWAAAGRGAAMERGHLPTSGQALERVPFDPTRPETFVDLGCGNGYIVRLAATRMHPEGTAIGLDLSPGMLKEAEAETGRFRARVEKEGARLPAVRFVEGTFDRIPLEDASVDHAYSNEAIYYAPDVHIALEEIFRILRWGGTFHCALDYYEENTASHDWPERTGLSMELDSAAGWRERFRAAGFADVRSVRLLDATPIAPLSRQDAADPVKVAEHEDLVAWKKETGTLLVIGVKDDA